MCFHIKAHYNSRLQAVGSYPCIICYKAYNWGLQRWPHVHSLTAKSCSDNYWQNLKDSKIKFPLTHWGRVTHIYVSKLFIIGSDNGLSPGRRQAIIWTNAGILLIWPFGTNFSEISIDIHTFSLKKINFKMSSGKWRPFCLGLNVLNFISDGKNR